MEWIDIETNFPECDQILCYGEGKIFICKLIESKWGYRYLSTESSTTPDWTHWMPLPKEPDAKNA